MQVGVGDRTGRQKIFRRWSGTGRDGGKFGGRGRGRVGVGRFSEMSITSGRGVNCQL